MVAVAAVQQDIYSTERASLREHLEILTGRTTWREPTPHSTKVDTVPYEHTLAAALAMARDRDSVDVGPDILECLIYQRLVHAGPIVSMLVCNVRKMSRSLARTKASSLHALCYNALSGAAYGQEPKRVRDVDKRTHAVGIGLATRLLWISADQTLERVGLALR